MPLFPPAPDDVAGWDAVVRLRPDLSPALPQGRRRKGDPEPGVRGMADGVADRVDRLRACGNGVVPAAAANAWRNLYAALAASAARPDACGRLVA